MPKHLNTMTQQEENYGYLYKTAFSQQDTYFNSNRPYPADWGNCENICGIKTFTLQTISLPTHVAGFIYLKRRKIK